MLSAPALALLAVLSGAPAPAEASASGPSGAYTPAPPEQVPGYFTRRITDKDLAGKSLRELTILRNTVYARWGWDGYRKDWLRSYIHAQPWFKPNPKFHYKLLSDLDKANVHIIATREQGFRSDELQAMRDAIYARHGKVWHDVPRWKLKDGKEVSACDPPDGDAEFVGEASGPSHDCAYKEFPGYKPNPAFKDADLSAEEKVELGLISRSMGQFSLDDGQRGKSENGLDGLLKVADLRQLSLRDLRILRNTIYARRGRPFKSQALRDHFSGMDWYKVDTAYTDAKLTRNDIRNIALIRSVEDEFGGPISDEEWLTEPAFDGA